MTNLDSPTAARYTHNQQTRASAAIGFPTFVAPRIGDGSCTETLPRALSGDPVNSEQVSGDCACRGRGGREGGGKGSVIVFSSNHMCVGH